MQYAEPEPNELARLVSPVWSSRRTAQALDIAPEELLARQRSGSLLAVRTTDGDEFHPAFQFQERGGRTEVKPGLVPLFRSLREYSPWAVAVLLRTPSPELQDMTPLEWLEAGRDPSAVAALGETVAREWSSGAPTGPASA